MSNLGLYEAQMTSDAFQLLGMSEIEMLRSVSVFGLRSKFGTPTVSILCSASGVLVLSWMSFQEILEFLNFLYSVGMLLEFAVFIKLRIKKPHLHRPFKVPVQLFGTSCYDMGNMREKLALAFLRTGTVAKSTTNSQSSQIFLFFDPDATIL